MKANPMSERLEALLQTMHFRNLRATMFYEDAAAENEFGHTTTPEDAYDWQTRRFIESGLCWRDPEGRREPTFHRNPSPGDRHDLARSAAA